MGRTVASGVVLAMVVGTCSLLGQAQSEQKPLTFDVVSVKPNTSGDVSVSMTPSPGGVTITNYTLQFLLRVAYQIQDFQIINAPSWLTIARFDVVGKTGTATTNQSLRPMLRAVLNDRFKFVAHTEARELPVYELKIAKSDGTFGPRFHSPSRCVPQIQAQTNAPQNGRPAVCDNKVLAGSMASSGISMRAFAVNLSVFLGRTVIDRTRFTGTFDYELTWTPEFLPLGLNSVDTVTNLPADPDRPPLPTALADQLGLKLESTHGPVEVLVIDHVERPTPD
jgi:uncharacterized protein (TIGR03435 family)